MWADVVCPWCYMGKVRLEKALASYPGAVTVRYRPFQLDPRPVEVSTPLVDAMARRFGGSERVGRMFAHTAEVAAGDGLTLHFDRAVAADTLDAHRLVWFAGGHGQTSEMLDAIFRAHFTDGVDLGSRPALAELAAGVGLDGASEFLADDDAGTAEVRASLAEARDLGITGVPMFVFAGRYAVSGAQPPETLRSVLAEVERREADLSRPVPR